VSNLDLARAALAVYNAQRDVDLHLSCMDKGDDSSERMNAYTNDHIRLMEANSELIATAKRGGYTEYVARANGVHLTYTDLRTLCGKSVDIATTDHMNVVGCVDCLSIHGKNTLR
jgi:hypothetical protein